MSNTRVRQPALQRGKWVVRWYEPCGGSRGLKHRSKAFDAKDAAQQFQQQLECARVASQHEITPDAAFGHVVQAWQTGRPIVFVFGAGLSAPSGIPTSRGLRRYLESIKLLIAEESREDARSYLRKHGFPSQHQLFSRRWLLREVGVMDDVSEDWRSKLRELIELDGQVDSTAEDLADRFFRTICRGAEPSIGHRFAAFLVRAMSHQPVVLTTCFDRLLEQTFEREGIEYDGQEVPDHGPMEEQRFRQLRGGQASRVRLLRLHASSYAQRVRGLAGGDGCAGVLESRLDPDSALRQIKALVPSDALLLVLGYAGGDRRTRHLLGTLADRSDDSSLIWVYRDVIPLSLSDGISETTQFTRYRDAGLFLQEVYARVCSSFPAGKFPYDALPAVPPQSFPFQQHSWQSLVENRAGRNQPDFTPAIHCIAPKENDRGTSVFLADCVERLTQHRDHVIWADLEEILSCDALISHILGAMSRIDPQLPPVVLSELAAADPAQAGMHGSSDLQSARVRVLLDALRRRPYVLAIHAVAEFGKSHIEPATELQSDVLEELSAHVQRERERIYEFIGTLMQHAKGIGDSKICIGCANPDRALRAIIDRHKANDLVREYDDAGEFGTPLGQLNWEALRRIVDPSHVAQIEQGAARGGLESVLPQLFERLAGPYQALLAIASAFRGTKHLVLLKRLSVALRIDAVHDAKEWLRDLGEETEQVTALDEPIDTQPDASDRYQKLDEYLARLSDTGLLIRQEGGFYRMYRSVRNWVYREIVMPRQAAAANLHHLIARTYYHRVYQPSKDINAYFESVFHRTASVRHPDPAVIKLRLLEFLRCLEQREVLLSQGRGADFVAWLQRLNRFEVEKLRSWTDRTPKSERDAIHSVLQAFRRTICELEAEVRRASTDFDGCMRMRIRQMHHRLCELELMNCDEREIDRRCNAFAYAPAEMCAWVIKALKQALPGAHPSATRLLAHAFDIGVCLKGLRRMAPARQLFVQLLHIVEDSPIDDHTQLKVRCHFRIMGSYVDQVRLWRYDKAKTPRLLKAARGHYQLATVLLEKYLQIRADKFARTGSGEIEDAFYRHYMCYLNNMRARMLYLEAASLPGCAPDELRNRRHQFVQAKAFLEAASTIVGSGGRKQATARTVCLLDDAELHMLYSDFLLKQVSPGQTSVHGAPWLMLQRARESLNKAERALYKGFRNVWWLTRLCQLKSQLCHESIAWSLHPSNQVAGLDRRELTLEGLSWIRDGLANIIKDNVRRDCLETLWLQLFIAAICCNCEEDPSALTAWIEKYKPVWESSNRESSLEVTDRLRRKLDRIVLRLKRLPADARFDAIMSSWSTDRRRCLLMLEEALIVNEAASKSGAASIK